MIEKIKKAYLVQDEYDHTDKELVKKVNEIIDVVNNLEKQYQKLKLNNKAIEEIKELYTEWENTTDDAKLETNPFGAVLNIIQRNIGE